MIYLRFFANALLVCSLSLACKPSDSLKSRQEEARDECWKSLVHTLARDLHTVKWTSEQGLDQRLTTSDSVFDRFFEATISQWDLKGNRAKIDTVYGGWQRIEYVCHYNPITTEVISVCYSDHPGECK